jgi:hypothetical protein
MSASMTASARSLTSRGRRSSASASRSYSASSSRSVWTKPRCVDRETSRLLLIPQHSTGKRS